MSDCYNTDDAVAAVAERLVEQGDVAELVDELHAASGELRKLLASLPAQSRAIASLLRRLSLIDRMVDAEGTRLVSEGYASRAERREWLRELARENAA